MRLPVDRALLALQLLCEGCSIRSIEREKRTILRLIAAGRSPKLCRPVRATARAAIL
jgi:hypothetical protein